MIPRPTDIRDVLLEMEHATIVGTNSLPDRVAALLSQLICRQNSVCMPITCTVESNTDMAAWERGTRRSPTHTRIETLRASGRTGSMSPWSSIVSTSLDKRLLNSASAHPAILVRCIHTRVRWRVGEGGRRMSSTLQARSNAAWGTSASSCQAVGSINTNSVDTTYLHPTDRKARGLPDRLVPKLSPNAVLWSRSLRRCSKVIMIACRPHIIPPSMQALPDQTPYAAPRITCAGRTRGAPIGLWRQSRPAASPRISRNEQLVCEGSTSVPRVADGCRAARVQAGWSPQAMVRASQTMTREGVWGRARG